jgi:hypothetical protein
MKHVASLEVLHNKLLMCRARRAGRWLDKINFKAWRQALITMLRGAFPRQIAAAAAADACGRGFFTLR